MPTIRRSKNWTRWAGPLSDVSDTAATAQALLSKWVGVEQPVRIVAAVPGQTISVDAWDEFEGLIDSRDLQQLLSLKVDVGDLGGPRVSMNFGATVTALLLEVTGSDRAQVAGVFNEVIPILDRGRQPGLIASGIAFASCILALPLATIAALLASGRLKIDADVVPVGERAGNAAVLLLALLLIVEGVGGLWVGRTLLPTLEILPPGRPPVLERFRGWVITGFVAVALSLVASVIYALVNNGAG